jgi:hypothetical protein
MAGHLCSDVHGMYRDTNGSADDVVQESSIGLCKPPAVS